MLDQANVDYLTIDATQEPDLAEKFDIMQAPTLIVQDGDTFQKFRGVSDIKGWLMNQ